MKSLIKDKMFIECSESTFMYFQNPISKLNFSKLLVNVFFNSRFGVYYSYSYDKINYSEFVLYTEIEDKIIDENFDLYVCIWFKRIISDDLTIPTKLYDLPPSEDKYYGGGAWINNVDDTISNIQITDVTYDGIQILTSDVKFTEYFELIDEFPRWNFYDKQNVNIHRWLSQCNAMAESYGHTVIYFKTEPVEFDEENPQSGIHGTHFQLSNNVIRNVVDVKKLHILFPNNEIPQDRTIFTEWDMPLQDDVIIHVVRQKFEQAFGLKNIPNEKDYLYFPMINKMFRVNTMQPKTGFMGVCGWYEVYLSKFEEDECVTINRELYTDVEFDPETNKNIFDDFNFIVDDGIAFIDNTKIVEEQKTTNQNYTNKLEDTTFYVSLKETEKLREFYDKRLKIVSVNPDDSLFPISMYNCSDIDRRVVGLQYNLTDYSVHNKFINTIENSFNLVFNYVQIKRFSGEVINIISEDNVIFSLKCSGKKFNFFDTKNQITTEIEHTFVDNELYQINIKFENDLTQYSIKIFKLNNRQKSLEYQNIYKFDNTITNTITNIQLFGGSYLINDIEFYVDKQKFIEDNCLPLLNMYKF